MRISNLVCTSEPSYMKGEID